MKPKYRPLDSCCGFASLKTGSLITGILCIIASILTLIFIIITDSKFKTVFIELSQHTIKIILGFNLIMTIIISSVLIFGVLKERKFFLVMWIVLGIMLIIGWVISFIYWGFYFFFDHKYLESSIYFITGTIVAMLYFYLWLVVYCFYLKLKEEDDSRSRYQKPTYVR